jgi:hypothetical protein
MGPDALEFRVPPGSPCPLPSTLWRKPADYPREADANSDKNTFRDVRTLRLLYDRQGQRFRAFQQAVSQCEHHTLADWPVPGPSTVMWVLMRGEGPLVRGMPLGKTMVDYMTLRLPCCIMSLIAGS